jgi:hypothetical protein
MVRVGEDDQRRRRRPDSWGEVADGTVEDCRIGETKAAPTRSRAMTVSKIAAALSTAFIVPTALRVRVDC